VRILQTVPESQILTQTEHSLFKDPSDFFLIAEESHS